jgi:GDPmannose 4,6-dehydratase|tara:strand:- start:733 stop:1716 length:984 start_codon:yes stop_codon:yes gene_type:complete
MSKTALITGITGQDGSYLAELLLHKGYEVHGIVRRVASDNEEHRFWRIRKIKNELQLHSASLESYASIAKVIQRIKPKEIYHLASQSFVGASFEDEFSTFNANLHGTHYMLSSAKDFTEGAKFYFAATSEMFGKVIASPQSETTPFYPRSVYGIAKLTGYNLTRNYREAYNFHGSSGILFNHESPRRGPEFVTRKISLAVARIKHGLQKKIKLGNIKSKRDWGHAKDFVEAMWLMLQEKNPDDYVIGTGEMHSVEEFARKAFKCVNLNFEDYLEQDKSLLRPAEVDTLLADYSKAKKILKWKPKVLFDDLVTSMVESDLEFVKNHGY